MRRILICITVIGTLFMANAGMLDFNDTNKSNYESSVVIEKHYTEANTSKNIQDTNEDEAKNPAQWRLFFTKQSQIKATEGLAGNLAVMMGGNDLFKAAKNRSITNLTTKSIAKDPAFSNVQSVQSASLLQDTVRGEIFVNSLDWLGSVKPNDQNTTKTCSITRKTNTDIAYKCKFADGSELSPSWSTVSNLQEQLMNCNMKCYRPGSCIQEKASTMSSLTTSDFIAKSGISTHIFPINNYRILNIKFDVNETENVYLSLIAKLTSGDEKKLLDSLPLAMTDRNITLDVDIKVNELNLTINTDKNLTVSNISFQTELSIPSYNCDIPSVVGDLPGGKFSSLVMCENKCVEHGVCYLSAIGTIITNDLSGIVNGCTDVLAKNPGCKLKEEYIDFSGDGTLTTTVQNYVDVPNVIRPKILATDANLTYRIAQETKDNAYANMAAQKTYDIVLNPFSVDSNASYAARSVVRPNTIVTLSGGQPRGLDLLLKPKKWDVRNGKKYRVYGLLSVDLDYLELASNKHIRDQIWYVLTSTSTAMPVKRIERYATITIGKYVPNVDHLITEDNMTTPMLVPIASTTEKYETFQLDKATGTGNWIAISENMDIADKYIWEGEFNESSHIWMIEFMKQIDDFVTPEDSSAETLPGVYRRIDTSTFTKYYTGNWEATGQAIVKIKAYAYYQKNTDALTVKDLINKAVPIWETGNENRYEKEPDDDSYLKNDGIKIYVNGDVKNTGIYTTIKVRPEFVGKPGFIFVFTGD